VTTIKYVTKGSVVWLDEAQLRYLRLPKVEGPRDRPEWSDERAGALQDAVWHPYTSWSVGPYPNHGAGAVGEQGCGLWPFCGNCPGLLITTPGGSQLWLPNATRADTNHEGAK
jgi:hypothetical protein